MAIDPVCRTPINPHTAKGGMIWYHGAPFYFCSAECKERFDIHPESFAAHGPIVPGAERGA